MTIPPAAQRLLRSSAKVCLLNLLFFSIGIPNNSNTTVLAFSPNTTPRLIVSRSPHVVRDWKLRNSNEESDSSADDSTRTIGSGDMRRRRRTYGGTDEPNYYDILGASPDDSQEMLKIRYQALAKKLHPDRLHTRMANGIDVDEEGRFHFYDLSTINAAWQLLSDPQARRRYDRELAARDFTDNFVQLVETGVSTALPWLQNTSRNTAEAAQQSAATISQQAQQAQKAYAAYEHEQKAKHWKRKAREGRAQASKLQQQAQKLSKQAAPKLKTDVSSSDAKKMLEASRTVTAAAMDNAGTDQKKKQPPPTKKSIISAFVRKDLETLRQNEEAFRKAQAAEEQANRQAQQADRQVQIAQQAEQATERQLKLAQKEYERCQEALLKARDEAYQKTATVKQTQSKKDQAQTQLVQRSQPIVAQHVQQHEVRQRDQQVQMWRNQANELKALADEWDQESQTWTQLAIETRRKQEAAAKAAAGDAGNQNPMTPPWMSMGNSKKKRP